MDPSPIRPAQGIVNLNVSPPMQYHSVGELKGEEGRKFQLMANQDNEIVGFSLESDPNTVILVSHANFRDGIKEGAATTAFSATWMETTARAFLCAHGDIFKALREKSMLAPNGKLPAGLNIQFDPQNKCINLFHNVLGKINVASESMSDHHWEHFKKVQKGSSSPSAQKASKAAKVLEPGEGRELQRSQMKTAINAFRLAYKEDINEMPSQPPSFLHSLKSILTDGEIPTDILNQLINSLLDSDLVKELKSAPKGAEALFSALLGALKLRKGKGLEVFSLTPPKNRQQNYDLKKELTANVSIALLPFKKPLQLQENIPELPRDDVFSMGISRGDGAQLPHQLTAESHTYTLTLIRGSEDNPHDYILKNDQWLNADNLDPVSDDKVKAALAATTFVMYQELSPKAEV